MESDKPIISIVLPVYNAGEYLRPCLDTLVNQTLKEIEIVCVLDCPTDGSDKVVEEYAANDSRIIIIRNEHNLHIGESRNVGMRVARGEYIGFSDHDDTRELEMYERLYAASNNGSCDMVMSGFFVVDNFGLRPDMANVRKKCLSRLIRREGTAHITPHIYKKSFIDKNAMSFVDTKVCFGEDILFNMNAISHLEADNDLGLLPEVFYHHLKTGNNTEGSLSYRSISKLSVFIHQAYDIVSRSEFGDTLICEMGLLYLKMSYWLVKRETGKYFYIHPIALLHSMEKLKSELLKDELCCDIVRKTSLKMVSTPLKIAFALWLKHIARNRVVDC